MSWPSKRISPDVGVEQARDQPRGRALAAAGLADDPERLAALDVEVDAVDGLHRADFALEDDPARDREVLDQIAHLRRARRRRLQPSRRSRRRQAQLALPASAPALRRPTPHRAQDRAAGPAAHRRECSRRLLVGHADLGERLVGHAPGTQLRPQAPAHIDLQQAGDVVVGLVGTRLQLRVDARVRGLGIGAARVEVAAGGAVDQARRACRGSARDPRRASWSSVRDRLEQAPRVRVLGRVEDGCRGGRARRSARRTSRRCRRPSRRPRRGRG